MARKDCPSSATGLVQQGSLQGVRHNLVTFGMAAIHLPGMILMVHAIDFNLIGNHIMTTTTLTRRALVATAGALAVVPAVAAAPLASSPTTTIGKLWGEAEMLRKSLDVHRGAIAAAAMNGGISGWMRLGGEANRIGEARYGRLVAILKAQPELASDLAIMGRVTLDEDMRGGSIGWAGEQLALATVGFHGAALA